MVLPLEQNRRFPDRQNFRSIILLPIIGFVIVVLILILAYGVIFVLSKISQEIVSNTTAEISEFQSSNDSSENEQALSNNCTGIHLYEDERPFYANLTNEQRTIFKEFKTAVFAKLTQNFMKDGSFLIQWLKANDWEIEDAEEMLMEHLEWRKEMRLDIQDSEDDEFKVIFPIYWDGVDRENRPVVTVNIADWDARREIVAGRGEEYLRFNFQLVEKGFRLIRKLQQNGQKNVTNMLFVINLYGFNMVQHGCFFCIHYFMKGLFALQDNYPGYQDYLYKIILINTPDTYHFILTMAPEGIGKLLEVYGANKAQWKEAVLRYISPEQIRPEFGGTKKDIDY